MNKIYYKVVLRIENIICRERWYFRNLLRFYENVVLGFWIIFEVNKIMFVCSILGNTYVYVLENIENEM